MTIEQVRALVNYFDFPLDTLADISLAMKFGDMVRKICRKYGLKETEAWR